MPRSLRWALLAAAGLALVLAAVLVAVRGARSQRPDVVLVVVDTLRASHLGAYGYRRATSPFLDAFAARNVLFRHAIAASPWTSPSVASLFAAVYPPVHGIHVSLTQGGVSGRLELPAGLDTLAETLQREGYWTAAVVANPWISRDLGFAQGFDRFEELFGEDGWRSHTRGERVSERAMEVLSQWAGREPQPERPAGWRRLLGARRAPFFLYVHYMDPHLPYEAPDALARRFLEAPPGHDHSDFGRPRVAHQLALYDAEIRYVDVHLGRFFAFLRERGWYRDAVVAITSDHGEQILEYGRHAHGYTVHQLELHVPLLMRLPGLRGVEVDAIVSTIDVAPTLLEAAGVERAGDVQGVSLLSALDARRERGVFAGTTYTGNAKAFVRGDGKKLIARFGAPPSAVVGPQLEERLEAYDSLADYVERAPLADEPLLRDLSGRFYDVYRDSVERGRALPRGEVEVDPKMLEQLRALGYAE